MQPILQNLYLAKYMNTRYLLSLSLLVLMLLQACCVQGPDQRYTIPADAYTWIPYDSNSTFRFQDTLGNVNAFVMEQEKLEEWLDPECSECCTNYIGQQYSMIFRGDNPAVSITISVGVQPYGGLNAPPYWSCYIYPGLGFNVELDGSDCGTSGNVVCHDSLAIRGQLYTEVMEFGATNPQGPGLWYNKTQGILKFRKNSAEIWELLP